MKKQLKTLLLGLVCAFATQTASAQDIYFGGTVGVGALETSYKSTSTLTNEKHTLFGGGTSFIGGGILGVEYTFCNNIYTAIEARALYNSTDRSFEHRRLADGSGYSAKIKNNFIYGGDFKLGVTLDCCVTPYVLVGVEAGKWKTTFRNGTAEPVFGLAADSSASCSKTLCAPKVGLGVRFPLCDVLAADLQYAYTWYGTSKHHFADPLNTNNEWPHKREIDQHKFMVSLNYSFSFLSCL
jgi:opacity protein-like surface antigen